MTPVTEQVTRLTVALMRPFGFALVFPIFSSSTLGSGMARNAIVLLAAFAFVPLVPAGMLAGTDTWTGFAQQMLVELAVGFVLGCVLSLPFHAVSVAGALMDNVRGATIGNVISPLTNSVESTLGNLLFRLFCALFVISGSLDFVIDALAASYRWANPAHSFFTGTGARLLFGELGFLFVQMLSLAAPAVIAMMLVDLSMGIVNRAVPNIEVFALAMPVKSLLGFTVIAIGMQSWVQDFDLSFRRITAELAHLAGS